MEVAMVVVVAAGMMDLIAGLLAEVSQSRNILRLRSLC